MQPGFDVHLHENHGARLFLWGRTLLLRLLRRVRLKCGLCSGLEVRVALLHQRPAVPSALRSLRERSEWQARRQPVASRVR